MNFLVSHSESIQIQEKRFGSFITHLFPMIATKLGGSYEQILYAYNLSFYSYFLATYLILYFRFKQYDLCVLFLGYHLLFVGDVFFWSNNEVHQGISWAFLGLGYYYFLDQKKKIHWVQYLLIMALVGLGIMTHLLVPIPILLVILYKVLLKAEGQFSKLNRASLFLPMLVVISVVLRYFTSATENGYDAGKLDIINDMDFNSLYNALFSEHAIAFYDSLDSINFLVIPLMITGVVILMRQSNKLYLLMYVLCILGYWVLLNLIYPYSMDRHLHFYMESEYMIMGIVILAPLVYFRSTSIWSKSLLPVTFSIILCVFSWKLVRSYKYFDTRIQNIARLVDFCHERNLSKVLVVLDKNISQEYFIMDWGLPIETLSYSQVHLGQSITLKMVDSAQFQKLGFEELDAETYLDCFVDKNIDSLSSKFFQIDTIHNYQIVQASDLLPLLKPLPQ